MERSTCFTKVADGFGWLAVLVIFSFFLLYNEPKTGGRRCSLGHFIFLDKPLKFLGMLLYPQKFRTKQGFSFIAGSVKLCQLHPLKIPEPKTRPLEIPIFFLINPGNSTSFLINSGNSAFYFFDTPRNSMFSTPIPCFVFFLEQPNVRQVHRNKLEIVFCHQLQKSHF